ncbi:unnamed protein product [Closterium sp. Naga37s-1]|nr:unnamed protein product [Closterium sp. Naga37s-1]
MEDPPYVAWMKEQKKQGKPSPSIKRMAKAKRDSAGASTSGGARRDYDDGADTDVSDDDLEEIVSESGSEADSDNYKDGSDDDGQDEDGGEEASGDDRNTRASKKEKRPPAPRNKRQWSDAELATLAAARWNTKDDLKAMQVKQGSQYWMKQRAHIVEGDASWNRDEGQMSNAWKRLEKKYLKTKRCEGQSGGKAIKKKPWWEYVYNLKKHSAKAKAHAMDGGGAATVDVPAYAPVLGTTERETSGPSSLGLQRDRRRANRTPEAGDTPPPKRRRVNETATMAAAKLVSDAINSTNANVAGVRLQMATPHAQQAAPQTTPDLTPPVDTTDANMAFSEEVAEQPEP